VYDQNVEVRFYATLRPIVGGKFIDVDIEGEASVRRLLDALTDRFPELGPLVWSGEGELRDFLKLFVNGRDVRHLQMLDTPVPADAIVDVFPPVAGG